MSLELLSLFSTEWQSFLAACTMVCFPSSGDNTFTVDLHDTTNTNTHTSYQTWPRIYWAQHVSVRASRQGSGQTGWLRSHICENSNQFYLCSSTSEWSSIEVIDLPNNLFQLLSSPPTVIGPADLLVKRTTFTWRLHNMLDFSLLCLSRQRYKILVFKECQRQRLLMKHFGKCYKCVPWCWCLSLLFNNSISCLDSSTSSRLCCCRSISSCRRDEFFWKIPEEKHTESFKYFRKIKNGVQNKTNIQLQTPSRSFK